MVSEVPAEGDEVFTCGFGYFLELKQPSLYKGYITRIVNDQSSDRQLFIQHTARTYPGQSGGALLTRKDGKF